MTRRTPYEIGGYVLAGGHSSRMGQDKALMMLAGKPLIEHAVIKLQRLCARANILSQNASLAHFAPLVSDLHPDCGPLAGIEAALRHSSHDWNLILPIDAPFLPTSFLDCWISATLASGLLQGTRIAMHDVDGVPQPAILMIHREMASHLTRSLEQGDYKLGPALHRAAEEAAIAHGVSAGEVLRKRVWKADSPPGTAEFRADPKMWTHMTPSQQKARALWFMNLNTPEQFAEAEEAVSVLDT